MISLAILLAIGAQTADTIPFEFVRNQVLVPVTIAGQGPYHFIVDTGVTPSALDLAVARALGLLDGDEPVGRAGGVGAESVPIYAGTLRGAHLGDLQLEEIPAAAMDMSGLSSRLGRPLHGILGHRFLDNRRVHFDYPNRRLVIGGEPPDAPAVGYAGALEFVEGDVMPLVRIAVNGVTLPVSLDTGSSLVLELYPDGAAQAGVLPDSGAPGTIVGARGAERVRTGRAATVRIGELELQDQEVTLTAGRRPGNRVGNLGNGFLQHFVLTVDYIERRVTLERAVEPR